MSGDSRWPGATRDDLLGQRAHQRSFGEIEETTATATTGGVSVPELPTLEDDAYLLEPYVTGVRRRRQVVLSSLHALALDTALSAGGDVVWIDAQGHATTHTLTRVAPSERALDRVHVARAFTTHHHHTLVEQVGHWLRDGSENPFGHPDTDRPAIFVCPALDALYREGELRESESRSLLVRALTVIGAIGRNHNIPVLVTRTQDDDYTAPIEQTATTITLEQTKFGPRFECSDLDFETLVYPKTASSASASSTTPTRTESSSPISRRITRRWRPNMQNTVPKQLNSDLDYQTMADDLGIADLGEVSRVFITDNTGTVRHVINTNLNEGIVRLRDETTVLEYTTPSATSGPSGGGTISPTSTGSSSTTTSSQSQRNTACTSKRSSSISRARQTHPRRLFPTTSRTPSRSSPASSTPDVPYVTRAFFTPLPAGGGIAS